MSTVSNLKISDLQTAPTQVTTDALVQDLFNKQRAYFATDVTKTFEWRVDQLDRLIRMLKETLNVSPTPQAETSKLHPRRTPSRPLPRSQRPNSRNPSLKNG